MWKWRITLIVYGDGDHIYRVIYNLDGQCSEIRQ